MATQSKELNSRRLSHELEHQIKLINSELISGAIGDISRDDFGQVARMVACLRARYLHRVLSEGKRCHSECIDTEAALELKVLREAYMEALEGFSALEHALTRGYIDLTT